jgi:hypothetical protein
VSAHEQRRAAGVGAGSPADPDPRGALRPAQGAGGQAPAGGDVVAAVAAFVDDLVDDLVDDAGDDPAGDGSEPGSPAPGPRAGGHRARRQP